MANPELHRPVAAPSQTSTRDVRRSRLAESTWRLNHRFILLLVATCVVCGVGIHFAHAFMLERNARFLKERSAEIEKGGDPAKARQVLTQYLRFQPDDLDATEKYVELLRQAEDSPRTRRDIFRTLETIVRKSEQQRDDAAGTDLKIKSREHLRRPLVEAALAIGRYPDAEFHLDKVRATSVGKTDATDAAELAVLAARVRQGQGRVLDSAAEYARAISLDPSAVPAYMGLARLIVAEPDSLPTQEELARKFPEDKGRIESTVLDLFPRQRVERTADAVAAAVCDRMVELGEPKWKGLFFRGLYRQSRTDLAGAEQDFNQAVVDPASAADADLLLSASNLEAIRAREAAIAGDAAAASARRTAARRHAEAGAAAHPKDARFYLLLTELEVTDGGTAASLVAAEKHLRDGLAEIKGGKQDARSADAEVRLRLKLASVLVMRAASEPGTAGPLRAEAQKEVERLRALHCKPDLLELVECRLAMLDGEWAAAAARLEALRPRLGSNAEESSEIDLMLAACYQKLQNPERRVEALRRIATPARWDASRAMLVEALAEAGRTGEALDEVKNAPKSPAVLFLTAELMLRAEFAKPAEQRDLSQVAAVVAEAERGSPGNPRAALLRARLSIASGDRAAAESLLATATATAQSPTAVGVRELWQLRLRNAADQKDGAALERLIAAAEAAKVDEVEVRIAKAELARLQAPATLGEVVAKLTSDVDGLSEADRARLFDGLAAYSAATARPEAGLAMRQRAAAAQPESLRAWLATAEAAREAMDEKAVREALAQIRRIEGEAGPNGDFVDAMWQMVRIARDADLLKDKPRLREALVAPRKLLTRAAQGRADRADVPRALGLLETLAGDQTAATGHFRRAYDLGDRSKEVVGGLAIGLVATKKMAEAAAIVRDSLQANPALHTPEMQRAAVRVYLEAGDLEAALAQSSALLEKSSEPLDRVFHGDLLFRQYQDFPEAERQSGEAARLAEEMKGLFRKLVDESPARPEVWLAYVMHMRRMGDEAGARAAVAEAERALPSEPARLRPTALARLYVALGEPKQAAAEITKAVEAAPDDAQLRLTAAGLLVQAGDSAGANRQLDWLLAPDRKISKDLFDPARRLKAYVTTSTGRYDDLIRAIDSLGAVSGGQPLPVADLRAQVALLTRRARGGERKRLIKILEEIRGRQAPSPEETLTQTERLLLVGLYESTGPEGREKAKTLLDEASEGDRTKPDFVAARILFHLRHDVAPEGTPAKDFERALERDVRPQLERLNALEPDSTRSALVSAEFDTRFGREDAANGILIRRIEQFVDPDGSGGASLTPQEAAELRHLADRAEQLGLVTAAEDALGRLSKDPGNPGGGLLLAAFLARQGRRDEAFRLIEQRPAEVPAEAAAVVAVAVVSSGRPSADELARAEAVVDQFRRAAPGAKAAAAVLGGLRLAQGRFDEAESLYRGFLAESPTDVSAMNNLAWLSVVTGKGLEEGERAVTEAIAVAGPIADLLDTRGMIRLSRHNTAEALDDLQAAFADSRTPVSAFHLALAFEQLGDMGQARKAFKEAISLGLSADRLHVTEIPAFERLVQRLGGSA